MLSDGFYVMHIKESCSGSVCCWVLLLVFIDSFLNIDLCHNYITRKNVLIIIIIMEEPLSLEDSGYG